MTAKMPFDPQAQVNYLPMANIVFAQATLRDRVAQYILVQILHGIESRVLPAFSPVDFWK